ncbi:putative cytidylate kinase [Nosema granulosis]|uniref:(d)CMP kinase n=1 Tax=Nosema granulosis TaxID=83296 RepID=A0A9P6GZT8_9MICR|nr:putative cytidylate kinase [Nosema granulosis]
MVYKIAIDGPAGSGKSTISEILRSKLGFMRINSGNLYRAVTFVLTSHFGSYNLEDPEIVKFIENISFKFDKETIFYCGENITDRLRTKIIDNEVMKVAKPLYVRNKVHKLQSEVIEKSEVGIIIEGRDIGTNILPDATLKIFLTASPEIRAIRRHRERPAVSFEDTLKAIKERDYEDINRKHGPLVVAHDAIIVDTDNKPIEDVVDKIYSLFIDKISNE